MWPRWGGRCFGIETCYSQIKIKSADILNLQSDPTVIPIKNEAKGYFYCSTLCGLQICRAKYDGLTLSRHHMRLIKGWRPASGLATRCCKLQIAGLLLKVRTTVLSGQ